MKKYKSKLYLNINGCARCGEDHIEVRFYPLTKPDEGDHHLWGMCPTLKEPLLAKIVTWDK